MGREEAGEGGMSSLASAPSAALRAGLADRYVIERELGGGGMSRVFLATETALGRQVVVKVIAPELAEGVSAERFAREMKLAARLQQANIVPVLSAGDANGLPYYTMPYVRGESLRARLATSQPLPVTEAVHILRDVARALAFAHGEGVVHRDIKPENILLSGGAAVVTDFGIAKAISAARTLDAPLAGLTQTGASIGTPAYMAPEQAAGDPAVDHRADLYAWGLVAWELLAGRHPFADRATPQAMLAAQLTGTAPAVRTIRADVPAALSDLVHRCLAKEPSARPASAAELLVALDQVTTPVTATIALPRAGRPWRGITVVGLLGALLLAVTWLLGRNPVEGPEAPGPRSLAVLPFASVGGDTANAYFAEGMADELATALAKVPGLQLAGRNSANAARSQGRSPQEIGKALGVEAVLQGTVRRAGDRMRVSVELTNAESGLVMWTESYEREVRDVFAVQDEIAREIVSALRVTLGGAGSVSPAAGRGTDNLAAYDDYLRGLYFFQRRGSGVRKAVEAYQAAIAKDSGFARAWAGLGLASTSMTVYTSARADSMLPLAVAAAERALALDPNSAEAYLALGTAHAYAGRWAEAGPAFTRSIALDSTLALTRLFYGRYLWAMGRIEEATVQAAAAERLDPLAAAGPGNLALILSAGNRHEEAVAAGRRAFELDSMVLPAMTGYLHALVGAERWEEARSAARRLLSYSRDPQMLGSAAYALGRSGDTAAARALHVELVARRGEWRTALARVRAAFGVGDTALALTALEGAVEAGEPIATNVSFLDHMYDPVRQSPRFAAVIRRYGLEPEPVTVGSRR